MSIIQQPAALDPDKLNQFVLRAVEEVEPFLPGAGVAVKEEIGSLEKR